jgi:hypothetical protein
LNRALAWDILKKDKRPVIFEVWWYTLIQDSKWKYYKTTWDVSDIIYISTLSKKERDFTKEIFDKILHPEKWNLLIWEGSVYSNEKRKFKKLLENDKYYIFFNRMIDFKRRKVFINNVKKHWDSVEWHLTSSVIIKRARDNVKRLARDNVKKYLDSVEWDIENPIILKIRQWARDNIKRHWDSVDWDIEDSVMLKIRQWVTDNVKKHWDSLGDDIETFVILKTRQWVVDKFNRIMN